MARLTREQRQAQQEASEKAYTEEFLATWPDRLMSLLERATNCGFQLEVEGKTFVVKYYDEWNDQCEVRLKLSPTTCNPTEDQADRLGRELADREAERAEAQRRAALVNAAKSKLSDEELDALRATFG